MLAATTTPQDPAEKLAALQVTADAGAEPSHIPGLTKAVSARR